MIAGVFAAADDEFLANVTDVDLSSIANSDDVTLILDLDLHIQAYNRAYLMFAQSNGLPEIERRFGLHSDIMTAISEPARSFYAEAYCAALSQRSVFHQDYECSSPEQRRVFHLSAYPIADGRALVISHHLVSEEPISHFEQRALASAHRSEQGLIVQCCHCRKVRNFSKPDRWDWVPALVERTDPDVSHTFCPRCLDHYYPSGD